MEEEKYDSYVVFTKVCDCGKGSCLKNPFVSIFGPYSKKEAKNFVKRHEDKWVNQDYHVARGVQIINSSVEIDELYKY